MPRTPAPPTDEGRTESVRVRVTPDELARLRALATEHGRTVSDVIRRATLHPEATR